MLVSTTLDEGNRCSHQAWGAVFFMLVRNVTADKVLEELKGKGGTVLTTSLDHTNEAALKAALADIQAAVPLPPG
jgi:uncharacterized membrane protein